MKRKRKRAKKRKANPLPATKDRFAILNVWESDARLVHRIHVDRKQSLCQIVHDAMMAYVRELRKNGR